ncbi:unnamed protein product [Nippostrongylus brasiliensis]|uniref:DUF1758 domain-containing protein n=1 Tax=Nippostrongylus brasiliensis TaxID=27835 RepID=A0A0N4YNF7_NIPBR|nr:unnamed protein product [Nippostrongylus brasiliensis]
MTHETGNVENAQGTHMTQQDGRPQMKALELPNLPIPTFSGNVWEWNNFWELFNSNIHSQPLPEMFKYNYLLKALRGESREAVGKFQVTKDNYERALQFLQAKYDNKEVLINNLMERLESCSLRGSTIKDQRSLLERIQVITTQLAENGEQVNSTWIIKKVLTKFPTSIRRKVIMRKQRTPSSSLTMAKVLQYLDEVLSNEEMCLLYTEKGAPDSARKEKSPTHVQFSRKHSIDSGKGAKPYSCMFCKGSHSPFECTKYTTPQDRAQYLKSNQLCLICASTLHKTLECKRRLCFECNGAHHTSCCFKQQVNSSSSISQQKSDRKTPVEPEKLTLSKKQAEKIQKKVDKPTPMVHTSQVLDDDTSKEFEGGNSSEEKAILQLQAVLNMQSNEKSFLPTGEITIQDPTTRKLRKIEVLLDSGAEVSFIDSSLASQLNLPIIREKSMTLHTFGTSTPREAACKLVKLEGWDGFLCTMELFTHDVLTRAFSPPLIPEIDQDVIRSLNLSICNKANKKIIKPSILLGCDHLWSFIRTDTAPIALPSGLTLLPTKLGYLISGKSRAPTQVLQLSDDGSELKQWDGPILGHGYRGQHSRIRQLSSE